MIPDSKNKLLKYRHMKSYAPLAYYLPKTDWMSTHAFWDMMNQYGRVVVKPTGGSRGRGVYQVTDLGGNRYQIHVEKRKIRIKGKDRTYDYLSRCIGDQSYIVQRWISRAKVRGRPFDLRVIIQRRRNSYAWTVTGKVAKVAGRGYIVSNITRSKGRVLPVRTAIARSSLRRFSLRSLQSAINRVSLLSAKRLSTKFPHHRIYGLDLALDRNGRPWIIEANLFPSRSHFRKLKDKTMLRRITAYKRG
jgi:glutathione synthase/RimK-type ligase-like ATP-grasp enzyme